MPVERTCFVAETNAHGAVVWVWRFGADDRIARPVAEAGCFLHEVDTAEVFGADRAEVEAWLKARKSGGI